MITLERVPESDPLTDLGVRLTPTGGTLRVWSENATAIELCIFAANDTKWITETIPLTRDASNVWSATSPHLVAGTHYSVRAAGPVGPTHHFNPQLHLIDPYARGLARTADGEWRSYVQDGAFDWAGTTKPNTPLDHTVIYEAHARGISKLNPAVPEDLRGTYAGLAHESAISYLKDLGVTAIQLLPIHQFVTEQRLIKQGLSNYWGYNTLNFFTPHAAYASRQAQVEGAAGVLREFKGMVKLLHEAGLEVILDVTFNHTAEESNAGPTISLRGLDNANYYRQDAKGNYIDVTGCGNTVNFGTPAAQRLVLDSLRYWANDVQIDGFRFDLAAALGRGKDLRFDSQHSLLTSIVNDPALAGVKMIAEPWDLGPDGWQVGRFPIGWSEWNDDFRDRSRDFWLTDVAAARNHGVAPVGIGPLAAKLSGSAGVFSQKRGPLASVNFVTAHDGFTLADLTAYEHKHNLGNGENNRDGSDNNRSFNHGVEGPTHDPQILVARDRAMRNLLGTLLLSAGLPMITAGDEFGRSQRGNNNAYCHDSDLTWLPWEREDWQDELLAVSKKLLRLRRENPAIRPVRYGILGASVPSATQMAWYNKEGVSMSSADWSSAKERTLQYVAASTPEFEEFNRILLVVHGLEHEETVCLPKHKGVTMYELLWNSAEDLTPNAAHAPGTELKLAPASMQLFRAV